MMPVMSPSFAYPISRTETPKASPQMMNPLIATGVVASVAGSGMVFAAWDASTIGMVVTAAGSLVTALTAAVVAVISAKSKARGDEMKLQMELRLQEMKVQMDAQRTISALNNTSLTNLHTAIAQNTVETVKGTAATDQVKQRVEQLEQKLPAPAEPQPPTP
jgi:putative exporter of polyketide antibiotics